MIGTLTRLAVFFLAAMTLSFAACDERTKPRKVSLEKKDHLPSPNASIYSSEPVFRIAVGGMITPREGFAYYRKFLDYIGKRLGRRVEFVDRDNYAEINRLIRDQKVDAAFVCGGPYVDGHDEFGMELLAAPMAYGDMVYYSYIIVPKDSSASSLRDLRNMTFAFTDPLSNTGKLVPTYLLAVMGENPERFFRKFVYMGTHDKSIEAVARKIVDGAAVDSLIWEYANRMNPEFTSRTKIIGKSKPFGIPPIVVRPGLDGKTKKKLRKIVLTAHADSEGRAILAGMMIEKFVVVDDGAYDSIREMKRWLKNHSAARVTP